MLKIIFWGEKFGRMKKNVYIAEKLKLGYENIKRRNNKKKRGILKSPLLDINTLLSTRIV